VKTKEQLIEEFVPKTELMITREGVRAILEDFYDAVAILVNKQLRDDVKRRGW
jgi:hypothetical protein